MFSSSYICSKIRANLYCSFITRQSRWPIKASYDLGRLLHVGGHKTKTDPCLLYRYLYFLIGMINFLCNRSVPLIRWYVHKHRHATDLLSSEFILAILLYEELDGNLYRVRIVKNTVQIAQKEVRIT